PMNAARSWIPLRTRGYAGTHVRPARGARTQAPVSPARNARRSARNARARRTDDRPAPPAAASPPSRKRSRHSPAGILRRVLDDAAQGGGVATELFHCAHRTNESPYEICILEPRRCFDAAGNIDTVWRDRFYRRCDVVAVEAAGKNHAALFRD